MRIRVGKPSSIRATIPLLAFSATAWALASGCSINNAVPAGAQHIHEAVRDSPDDAKEDATAQNVVSVPFMLRGYCYAESQFKDMKAPGGFGTSDNTPRKVRSQSNGRGLFLLAQPGVVLPFAGRPGMRVTLVNQTRDLLAFDASDSRMSIIQEAQDADGKWRPVEYLPSSWCGNSYHRVFLAPNYFWAFSAPRYKGTIPTKLRFTMALAEGVHLHSNTFEGSINSEQFTVKQGHNATNLMDPYND